MWMSVVTQRAAVLELPAGADRALSCPEECPRCPDLLLDAVDRSLGSTSSVIVSPSGS